MKLRVTISKYHWWYFCQISLQIMLLPLLIVCKSIDNVRKMELKLKDPHLTSFPDLLTPILCKQNRFLDEDVKCIMTFPENT